MLFISSNEYFDNLLTAVEGEGREVKLSDFIQKKQIFKDG